MCSFGKGGQDSSNQAADMARAQENQRQQDVRVGTSTVNNIFDQQFTPDYFHKLRQGFLDYANPQLEQQYGKAGRDLTYALTRSGNLESSTRGQQFGDLQRLYDTNRRSVADNALSYENQSRNAVEGARGDLISMLNTTGDATGATNHALARATALSAPPAYSPLGDMFSSVTGALATQAQLERAAALSGGAIQPRYNTGLFGAPRSAIQVTA